MLATQAISYALNEVSRHSGCCVTMGDSPTDSNSRNAIVLVGPRPGIILSKASTVKAVSSACQPISYFNFIDQKCFPLSCPIIAKLRTNIDTTYIENVIFS